MEESKNVQFQISNYFKKQGDVSTRRKRKSFGFIRKS